MSLAKVNAIQEATAGAGVTITGLVADSPTVTLPAGGDADLTTATLGWIFVSGIAKTIGLTRLGGFVARQFGIYIITDPKFGALGNNSNNDAPAFASALTAIDAAGSGILYVPRGANCRILSGIAWSANASLQLEGAITAGAAMGAMIQTPAATLMEDKFIEGHGFLYAAGLANTGLDAQWVRSLRIGSICVEDWLTDAIVLGYSGAGGTSYSVKLTGTRTHRRTATVPASSRCLYVRTATDIQTSGRCEFVGGETGVQTDTGASYYHQIHCWVRNGTGAMKYGFIDNGNGNDWHQCYADTPTVYGFWSKQFGSKFRGCQLSNTVNGGLDNVVEGIRFEQATPNASVSDFQCDGADSSHRVLRDIDFGPGTGTGVEVRAIQPGNFVTNVFGSGTSTVKLRVAMGTPIKGHKSLTTTWDAPSVASGAFTSATVSMTGAVLGDTVAAAHSVLLPDGCFLFAQVSAADTVKVYLFNFSGGAVDLASGNLRVDWWQH